MSRRTGGAKPAPSILALGLLAAIALAGCGSSSASSSTAGGAGGAGGGSTSHVTTTHATTSHTTTHRAPPPGPPQVLGAAHGIGTTPFVPAVRVDGRTAVWVARSSSGVALLSFDQPLLTLHLHSGTVDDGTLGWRYGPTITGSERGHVVAAFNGAFKLSTGAGGFYSYGRTGAPLQEGLGSIVTYSDGTTDVGTWHAGVPAPGHTVVAVRQNLKLLIDHGAPAADADCPSCWGAALGGVADPARGALGVTADGHLIWAGGEHLTPSALASALLSARVVRAVELDINPEWVAAYLYAHGAGGSLTPVPVMPGQNGIPGQFLAPYSRDFFTVTTR